MATNEKYEIIYLQPPNPYNEHAERLWCEDRMDNDPEPDDVYVRADLVKQAIEECIRRPKGQVPDLAQRLRMMLEEEGYAYQGAD